MQSHLHPEDSAELDLCFHSLKTSGSGCSLKRRQHTLNRFGSGRMNMNRIVNHVYGASAFIRSTYIWTSSYNYSVPFSSSLSFSVSPNATPAAIAFTPFMFTSVPNGPCQYSA